MTVMEELRRSTDQEILDYRQVMEALKDYAKPRDKLGALLERGSLIRAKKGLYVFGDVWRRKPLCRELVANLVYGPSYVSGVYALSRYALIPERVETITSVTSGKARRFETPLGLLTYTAIPLRAFSPGITRTESDGEGFLIATPEKALADQVWMDRRFRPTHPSELEEYLMDDLRLDPERLKGLDRRRLQDIAQAYDSSRITLLAAYMATHSRRVLR